jgi:hypothetical protein
VTLDHEYRPDPKTARCLDCPEPERDRRTCLWCRHGRASHTGRPDAAVKLHLSIPNPEAGKPGQPERISTVKWSASACGRPHCACKRYES